MVQLLVFAATPSSSPAHATGVTGSGGEFIPVTSSGASERILSTTAGTGGYTTPMPVNTWRSVQVDGLVGIPASGVAAVAVTFTAFDDTSDGWLKADKDETTPNSTISYLFWTGGQQASNSGVVAVGSDGKIQVEALGSSADLYIDVQGYYTAGDPAAGGFVPTAPTRVVDTRTGVGLPDAPLAANSTTPAITIAGGYGVPSSASAVMLNFLVTNETGAGRINPYPADEASRPQTALSFGNDGQYAMAQPVRLSSTSSSGGAIRIYTAAASTDLVVDVIGYYTASSASGDIFTPSAARVWDSRPSGHSQLGADAATTVQVSGVNGLPASGIDAIAADITIFDDSGTTDSWVHAWPDDQTEPNPSFAATYHAGDDTSNLVTLALGADGGIKIHNMGSDSIDYAVDVEGWYSTAMPLGIPDSALCVTPNYSGCAINGATYSLNPTLQAATTDALARQLTYTFELWTDYPAGDGTPSLVSRGTATAASGAVANWHVPSALTNHANYRYRVQAANPNGTTPWSEWFSFTTNAPVSTSVQASIYDSSADALGAFQPGETRAVDVAGVGGLPSATSVLNAVTASITATPVAAGTGHIDAGDPTTTDPTDVVSFSGGSPVAAVSALVVDGDGTITLTNTSTVSVNIVLTVSKWWQFYNDTIVPASNSDPALLDPGADADPDAMDTADDTPETDGESLRVVDPASIPDGTDAAVVKADLIDDVNAPDAVTSSGCPATTSLTTVATTCSVDVSSMVADESTDFDTMADTAQGAGEISSMSALGEDPNQADTATAAAAIGNNGQPVAGLPADYKQCNLNNGESVHYYSRIHSCERFRIGYTVAACSQDGGCTKDCTVNIYVQLALYLALKSVHVHSTWTFITSDAREITGPYKTYCSSKTWTFAPIQLSDGDGNTSPSTEYTESYHKFFHINWDFYPSVELNTAADPKPRLEMTVKNNGTIKEGKSPSRTSRAGIRTDNFGYLGKAGSAFPDVAVVKYLDARTKCKGKWQTLYPESTIYAAVAFIDRAQSAISDHVGRYFGDNPPLRRVSPEQRDLNRAARCGGDFHRYPDAYPPDSCDEYPFAVTNRGGATARRGHVNLPANSYSGTLVGGFMKAHRIAIGDPFFVNPTHLVATCTACTP